MGFRDYLKYDLRIVKDSFRRTRVAVAPNWIMPAIIFVVGAAIYFLMFGWAAAFEEISWVISGVLAVLLIGIVVFSWNVASAPYRFWKQDQERIRNLKRTIEERSNVISKHDVSLRDAIYYIATRKWGELKALKSGDWEADQPIINSVVKAWNDARQVAYDGDLPIWGKRVGDQFSEMYFEINDPSFWQTKMNWINWFYLASDIENENPVEHGLDQILGSDPLYYSLATSKAKVEEIWPPANT